MLVYSDIVMTYETLLTYDVRIRNTTDPRFHLVLCYRKHFFESQMKNDVSYKQGLTVLVWHSCKTQHKASD